MYANAMPWTTGKQPLTRGGNLLVQNACLDHFRDGLSDGRRRSQLPLQFSINQSIRAWITAICRHAQLLGGVYSCSMAVEYNSSAIIDSSSTDSARTSGFPGCCLSPGSEVYWPGRLTNYLSRPCFSSCPSSWDIPFSGVPFERFSFQPHE